jgi:filamentous hemagglutinin
MQLFREKTNQFLALTLSTLLTIQPLAAIDLNDNGIQLEGGGNHRPSEGVRVFVDGAKDTAPIVNINTPNATGLSHNTYNHFNVSTGGLILNNSATNVDTNLAGWVEGNPNLSSGSEARLILNEVVSAHRSQLNGFLEVSGKKADVIVANPNGITLNGAGFINTDRVTLTTGRSVIGSSGQLDKFIVEQGDIFVEGESNLLEQTQIDILTRAFILNQKLYAKTLNIRSGANEVNYDSLEATPITGTGEVPSLSVDVAALGGMYANVISLEATELGVGVNMAGELLSETNLDLDVNGEIKLIGKTQASDSIDVEAISVEIDKEVLATDSVNIQATDTITMKSATDLQANDISLTSTANSLTMEGGEITATNSAILNAATTMTIDGTLKATNEVQLTSNDSLHIGGGVESTSVTAESTASDVIVSGSAKAVSTLTFTAANTMTLQTDSTVVVEGDTVLTAENQLQVDGDIQSDTLELTSNQNTITLTGDISTDSSVDVEAASTFSATGATINSDGTSTLKGTEVALTNSEVVTKETMTIEATSGDITLDGTSTQSQEASQTIQSTNTITLTNDSSISAATTLDLISDVLTLNGSSASSGEKLFIYNDGSFLSTFSLTSDSTLISENSDVEIHADTMTNSHSQIIAGNDLIVQTDDLTNTSALLFALQNVTVDNGLGGRASTILNKESDIVAFNGSVTLKAQSVTNEGTAPTYIEDGYVATWYETASGSSDEVFEDTYKLLKDDVKLASNEPKPEYYQAYIELLTSLMKAEDPSEEAKALVKDSVKNADGTLKTDMIGTWNQLSGKATEEGIDDFDAHLKTLLVSQVDKIIQDTDEHGDPLVDEHGDPVMVTIQVDLVKEDGTIDPDYLEAYVALWESAISGDAVTQSSLDILSDDAKDEHDNVKTSITSVWDDIRTVSGAGYEIKKTLTADVLNGDGVLAQIIAGSDVTIDTGVMTNEYANISAGGDISITSDTSITNNAYGASQTLHEVHKTACFTCHTGNLGFRETFGGVIEAQGNINFLADTLSNTVTATRNTSFNLPHLDEFHDVRSNSNPVPDSFVVVRNVRANEVDDNERAALVDATAEPIDLSNSIAPFTVASPNTVELNFGTFTLPVSTNKPYEETTETRFTYTNYGEFLSSDYMVQRLTYSPEHENRLNGDEWALNGVNRSQSTLIGNNINLTIRDAIDLEGGLRASNDIQIDTEGNLVSTSEIVAGGQATIVAQGDVTQSGGGIKADSLTIDADKNLNLIATKVDTTDTTELNAGEELTIGSIRQERRGYRGEKKYHNVRDLGTTVTSGGDVTLSSGTDTNVKASQITSKGGSVRLKADGDVNVEAGEQYQELSWSSSSSSSGWGGLKKKTTKTDHREQHLTHTASSFSAKESVEIAGDNVTLKGVEVTAQKGDIAFDVENDLRITSVVDQHITERKSETKKSFAGFKYGSASSSYKEQEFSNQKSIAEALGDIGSRAGGTTTVQASDLKAGGTIRIQSGKGIEILSAFDRKEVEAQSTSNSFGSLVSLETQDRLQQATVVSSLINANDVTFETDGGVVIEGSQVQADVVNFTAQLLSLVSAKDSHYESHFSDGSGVILRTIINSGEIREEAVEASVTANEISLNGQTLLDQAFDHDQLLQRLSSEGADLDHASIEQVKALLNNKEWYDKTTTLSKMGQIIVQTIATIMAPGAGTALVQGMSATAATMINAAIVSLQTQFISATMTAALTGNGLELDLGDMLENSLKSAAMAGLTASIDTEMGFVDDSGVPKDLSFGQQVQQSVLHGVAQKAVYGGDLEDILTNSVVGATSAQMFNYIGHESIIKDNLPAKAVVHGLVGGALAELRGGDFSSAAVGTATAHVVGEYVKEEMLGSIDYENPPFDPNNPASIQAYTNQINEKIIAVSSLVSGAVTLATHENVSDEELEAAQEMGSSVVENNALCGGLCIAGVVAVVSYVTATGDGNPLIGLEQIGKGEDPLSEAIASGVTSAVEFSSEHYPEQTQQTLELLSNVGETISATVEYVDDATGNRVSAQWNELDETTQNRLKGGGVVVSLFLPAPSVKAIGNLKDMVANAGGKLASAIGNAKDKILDKLFSEFDDGIQFPTGQGEVGNILNDTDVSSANFAQTTIRRDEHFSKDGQDFYQEQVGYKIQTVDDLVNAIHQGDISTSDIPVAYITNDNGVKLILNTRTSVALERAGIPKSEWKGNNVTGQTAYIDPKTGEPVSFDKLAQDQLNSNNLPEDGSEVPPKGRQ